MEAGSRLLLIDEDTSATNFMVRDDFMQQVISRNKEPITPFLERARELYEKEEISTILVAGSSGAFFFIADKILQMDSYRPVDITDHVKDLCMERTAPRIYGVNYAAPDFKRAFSACKRRPDSHSLQKKNSSDKGGRNEHMKIKTISRDAFSIDKETVDLRYVEQLTDFEQTAALAHLLGYGLKQLADGSHTVRQTVHIIYELLDKKGWAPFCGAYIPCGLAKPREQEIFACLNRYRG